MLRSGFATAFNGAWAPLKIKGLILPSILIWASLLKLVGLWQEGKPQKSNSKNYLNANKHRRRRGL